MKIKAYLLLIYLSLISIFILNSSSRLVTGYRYQPIFMERSELEKSVSYETKSRDLNNPGKIYYKHPYIYINEKYKGIHVINNTNPSFPVKEGFIIAPGCIDIAIKEDVLYLDNAVDLVAFDLKTKQVTSRIKNVFPEPISPDNNYFWRDSRPDNYIIVDWEKSNK